MIYQKSYEIKNPKAMIIILHGMAEHSKRYDELALKLNQENYECLTYDQIGHGKSRGKRGEIKSFHEHVDLLHHLVLQEKNKKDQPIYLLGHSMGATIAHLYAIKYGGIAGIISSSGVFTVPKPMRFLKYTGSFYIRKMAFKTKRMDPYRIKDQQLTHQLASDPLMLDKVYGNLLSEICIKAIKYIDKNKNDLTQPVIYFHGVEDKIISVSSSIKMYETSKSTDKTLKLYEHGYHELLNDREKEEVFKTMIQWLDQRSL